MILDAKGVGKMRYPIKGIIGDRSACLNLVSLALAFVDVDCT